jgi:hypothetical protein
MLPMRPKIPSEPVPLYLEGIIEVHSKAAFWARFATGASVLAAGTFMALALLGHISLLVGLPFFLAPLIPIAAETRLMEIRRLIEDQLRDQIADRERERIDAEDDPPIQG